MHNENSPSPHASIRSPEVPAPEANLMLQYLPPVAQHPLHPSGTNNYFIDARRGQPRQYRDIFNAPPAEAVNDNEVPRVLNQLTNL